MKEITIFLVLIYLLQFYLISKGKKTDNSKFWLTFKSIFVTIMIILPLYLCISFFMGNIGAINNALALILLLIVAFIMFLLQWFNGIAAEKKTKSNNPDNLSIIKGKKFDFKVFIVTILLFIIISIIPSVLKTHIIKSNTIKYLNNKYGNCEFNVVNVNEIFSYDGFVSKYLTGYSIRVRSNTTNSTFDVSTDLEGEDLLDNFANVYYKQYCGKILSQKYGSLVSIENFDINKRAMYNFGHIPTIDELSEINSIDSFSIQINENFNNDTSKKIELIKKISTDLINYCNISKGIDITFFTYVPGERYYFEVHLSKDTIKIEEKDNNKKFEFKVSDIIENK